MKFDHKGYLERISKEIETIEKDSMVTDRFGRKVNSPNDLKPLRPTNK